jgi:micrococcal nuclease
MFRWIPVACVALLLCGCARHAAASTDGSATVVRVIDGDTIVVRIGGHDENVRLIGIDTPETHKPDTPVECFGPEASARMAQLLPVGTPVRLERDTEARDRYGRLLAYVYRSSDDLFVERTMLDEGYAGALDIPPNSAHRADLGAAAAAARAAARGLWPVCGGNHVQKGG